MLVIGLTGGIGSGKTTVAKLFTQHGVKVIDTDQLARDVTQTGRPALKHIVEKFGPGILNADQSLNRTALRKIIFADDQNRIWLEELLHPLIREEMKAQVESAKSPYVIVVIPLLVETKPNPLIERVLIVDTSEAEQIKRTQLRDNATAKEIEAIIKTQATRKERLAAADDIIVNNGSMTELKPEVDRLHGFYLALAQKNLFK